MWLSKPVLVFGTGSLSLLADAAHNLTDVGGLLIAWGAAVLALRQPTARHTYGLGQATVLAALINAIAILMGVGAIAWEAIQRFHDVLRRPCRHRSLGGVDRHRRECGHRRSYSCAPSMSDLNARAAFLHMASDAAVSAGVVLAAAVILRTGWMIVDPIVALLIAAAVAWSSFGLFKSALHMSLSGVPDKIDIANVEEWLRARPGVTAVHDLHVWPLSTTSTALTAHLSCRAAIRATRLSIIWPMNWATVCDHPCHVSDRDRRRPRMPSCPGRGRLMPATAIIALHAARSARL